MNGAAAGFGAALAAMCDIVVMAEDAVLGDPHVLFGTAPSLILQLVWPRQISLAVARDLLMTGRKIGGEEALRLGLASRTCASGEALPVAEEIAAALVAMPPGGLEGAKRTFNRPVLGELDALHPSRAA